MKTQLKRVASVYTGTTPPTNVEAYYESEDVAWFTPGDIPSDNIYSEGVSKRIANLYFEEKSGKLFPKESVLMVGIGATVGKVCYSEDSCYSNQQINAIVFNRKKVLPKFGAYYLLNKSKEINTKTPIVTLQIFNQAKVKQIEIEYPDLDTQRSIVSYLDSHVSSIDKRVSLLTTKRDHYLRLKTAIINRAVTQGLNPDVKMKDSGVEWIGMIPEHWEVTRILETARRSISAFIDGDWIETPDIAEEGVRYITSGNVGALKYKEQGAGFITEETFEALHCTEVFPGDLLISRLNPPIGRTCIVPDLGTRIVTCVDNVIYRPNTNRFDKQFLVYLMNCQYYSDYVTNQGRGATMKRISRSQLAKIKIIVPPLSEQQAIATYLDEKCTKIDAIIENLNQQIEKHKLLKRALINEVITGQRAV